jgi:hypothetical protein
MILINQMMYATRQKCYIHAMHTVLYFMGLTWYDGVINLKLLQLHSGRKHNL